MVHLVINQISIYHLHTLFIVALLFVIPASVLLDLIKRVYINIRHSDWSRGLQLARAWHSSSSPLLEAGRDLPGNPL